MSETFLYVATEGDQEEWELARERLESQLEESDYE